MPTPSPSPSPSPTPTPDPTDPTATDPTDPTTPDPTDPTTPDPSDPDPTNPEPTDPDPTDPDPTEPANQSPTVSIVGSEVRNTQLSENNLRAEASDPDGDSLTYLWEFVGGGEDPNANITQPTQAATTVTFAESGDYAIQVTVSDGNGGTVKDNVDFVVTLENPFEVAISGPETRTVSVGEVTELSAAVENFDDRILSYQWSVTEGSATGVVFSSPTTQETDVTFSAAGEYTLEFLASDTGLGGSANDTVEITLED